MVLASAVVTIIAQPASAWSASATPMVRTAANSTRSNPNAAPPPSRTTPLRTRGPWTASPRAPSMAPMPTAAISRP